MTDEQILAILADTNYAAPVYLGTTKLGPGRERWVSQLARLSPVQRLTLETKLSRHAGRLQRELDTSNFAKMPLPKRLGSGI